MIEVGTPEVKTVYWIMVGLACKCKSVNTNDEKSRKLDPMKLTLNCESIGSKRD